MDDERPERPLSLDAVHNRRRIWWENGYHPFAVYSPDATDIDGQPIKNAGKRAKGSDWRSTAFEDPPPAVCRRPDSDALNTGFATGDIAAIDIDVLRPELVDRIVAEVERLVGRTPLVRQGQPPKLAMLYRVVGPYSKITTAPLQFAEGEKPTSVEIMARGQSLVIDGVHPGTRERYRWLDQDPIDVKRADLPVLEEGLARAIAERAEAILREAGAQDWVNPNAPPPRPQRSPRPAAAGSSPDGFFGNVNDCALASPEDWVPRLFPGCNHPAPNGAWRIPARLRGLPGSKQDLSIHTNGIRDFHSGETFSAIDLVLKFGDAKDPLEAARWLCERLHLDPARLGFRDRLTPPPPVEPDDWDEVPPPPGDGGGGEPPLWDDPPGPPGDGGGPHNRRTIFARAGDRHKTAEEGLVALREFRAPLYQRGGRLVRVCSMLGRDTDGKEFPVPNIVELGLTMLARYAGQAAHWTKADRKGNVFTIDPPDKILEQMAAMVEQWPFGPIDGVVATPTLRRDGSLLQRPGYDRQSGLYLALAPGLELPPLSECPSRGEALLAKELLLSLLGEFPFKDAASRSVGLSLLITPVVRGCLEVAPAHVLSAPTGGTGKTYLLDLSSLIATGEKTLAKSMAPQEEETEKRLVAAVLGGHLMIVVDNVSRLVRGDFLCQVVERPIVSVRRLGTSDETQVRNGFVVCLDGNNIKIADDMVRRCVLCTIDANMAEPERRQFAGSPHQRVRANRGRYVAAALTIVRAYLAAGLPDRLDAIGSFGDWSDRVRSALVWLGETDPLISMQTLRREDPVFATRERVFAVWAGATPWFQTDPERGFLTSELVGWAESAPEFYDALMAIAAYEQGPNAGKINPKRLGQWLSRQENTVAAGCKLLKDTSDAARPRWRLQLIGEPDAR